MKAHFSIFLLLLFVLNLKSQNELTDSLIFVLSKTTLDVEKVKVLNDISNAFKISDPNQVINYGLKALKLAKDLSLSFEEGKAHQNLGNGNIIKGDYLEALSHFSNAEISFNLALKNADEENIRFNLGRVYGSMGIVHSEQGNYAKSLENYSKSITIYEDLKSELMLSRLYNNVAVVYRQQEKLVEALSYFNKAKLIQEKNNDPNLGITITNIATCYLKNNDTENAIINFKEARPFVENNPRALGEWFNSMGNYYVAVEDFDNAILSWKDAIPVFNKIDDKFGLADSYIFMSQVCFDKNMLDEAILYSNKSLGLSSETNVFEQMMEAEKVLAYSYELKGDFKNALSHNKKFNELTDKIENEETIKKNLQAEMNFELALRENKLKVEKEKQLSLSIQKEKQFKLKVIFIALSILLLLGIAFLYYSRIQIRKNLTLQKELTEYEQKALHLQMNPHFIFNCLGAISGFIIQNGTDHAIKYLAKFSKLMRLTLEYSKESLIPIEKEVESLKNYLELEKLRFNDSFDFSINVSSDIEDDVGMPPLLIQPLIENGIIHGLIPKKNGGKIDVNFSIKNENLICEITDNGVGIEHSIKKKKNTVQIHKSMALDIIKKRLDMISKVTNKKATLVSHQLNDNGEILGTKVILSLAVQYID